MSQSSNKFVDQHDAVEHVGDAASPAGRLDDQLCFALYSATNAVTRVYRPLLSEIGLTYSQYLVMLILWEQRSQQMGEIADRLRLATHAVSPIVDRLADAGLVNRIRDSSDGRVVHVRLTRSGSDLQAAAARIQDQVRVRTFLDDDEIVRVRDQLIAMVDRMGASDAGA
jgi:DNA-binding MarR family transcriptional regulator